MRSRNKLASARRDLRERDVRVVMLALVVAVATVATIGLFAALLHKTLVTSASTFLAADRQLEAEHGRPIPQPWWREATERGIQTAHMVRFSTMVFAGGSFQLVSVKAVDDHYPLRGDIEMQPDVSADRQVVGQGPRRGEVWLNPRLMSLLALSVGDRLEVGTLSLTVTGLLLREPDGGFSMASLAPRIMMHAADVPATGVIQEGSRVEYVALFAGDESELEAYYRWLRPQLEPGHEWESVRDGETLSRSLQRAERFLLLGGSLAVVLAAVAVAVASREYALGQRDTVALLKTLGMTGPGIGRLYLRRLLLWGCVGCLGGLLVALPVYWAMAAVLEQLLARPIDSALEFSGLIPAVVTALVSLFAFAYPPVRRLQKVPAMGVLRSEPGEANRRAWPDMALAGGAITVLVGLYTRESSLVMALLAGLVMLLAVLALVAWALILVLRRVAGGATAWRLALVALYRHRRSTLSQISVFAMTVMLATTLLLVRTSLLSDWQNQLPAQAPNHFLINIAPADVADVAAFWQELGHPLEALYPMVRGRLTELNGQPVRQAVSKDREVRELNRELNLTWMAQLPQDNQIVAGQWFDPGATTGVSVEAQLAERLGLQVGDQLGFTVGSAVITEPVTSIRTVQWDCMKPNFYMAFPPDSELRQLPATWITSFYLPSGQKAILNEFAVRYPTVSVLEVDHIIERIQAIVRQVTQAVEAILALILAAALVVMAAVVSATLRDRQREGALLRTLGGRQQLLVRSTMLEFALLGLIAGVLGVLAAEAAVWGLQQRMFEGGFHWHWQVILPIPLVSSVMLAGFGRWQLAPMLNVSPMLLLRRLE